MTEVLDSYFLGLLTFGAAVYGSWTLYKAKENARKSKERADEQATLIQQVATLRDGQAKMGSKLDNVRRYLRDEQAFSHKWVLYGHTFEHFLRREMEWRARHFDELPGNPPDHPDPDEIATLIRQRPVYDD